MHLTQHTQRPLTGMTIAFPRLDFEAAVEEIVESGYGGVEVFSGQLAPGVFGVPEEIAGATIARRLLEASRLEPIMLNAIDGSFEPLTGREASVDALARHMRLAAALGMPRILVWDGKPPRSPQAARDWPRRLASCLVEASEKAELSAPPTISVELHPFTFALKHDLLEETAAALSDVDAGICLDIAHFAVALGADFATGLSGPVLDAINHVHWSDSDCRTEGFHFSPGEGIVDLDSVEQILAGRPVVLSLDLFGHPTPRQAMRTARVAYAAVVERHKATLGPAG